jgi:hypothetical protein
MNSIDYDTLFRFFSYVTEMNHSQWKENAPNNRIITKTNDLEALQLSDVLTV